MKPNMKLFLGVSLLALILVLAGCGGSGGGGGKKTPKNSLSSDYFGLEVNYTLNYNCSLYDVEEGPNNISATLTQKVLSEEEGVFKIQTTVSISPGYAFGDYIEKNADGNYYERGVWDTEGGDYFYNPPYDIIISNPLYIGFKCWRYGEVVGQENVTVPAGTFNAWVFEYALGDENDGYSDLYYFVPNIGIVKYIGEEFEEGEKIFSIAQSLTSYYVSSSTASTSLMSQSVNSAATSYNTLKLRKIFRHKK